MHIVPHTNYPLHSSIVTPDPQVVEDIRFAGALSKLIDDTLSNHGPTTVSQIGAASSSTTTSIPTKRPLSLEPPKEGSYRQRRRDKSKAASKANKANPLVQARKKELGQIRLKERQERDSKVVRIGTNIERLKAAESGFSGSPKDWDKVDELLNPSSISKTLRSLLPVEYECVPLPSIQH